MDTDSSVGLVLIAAGLGAALAQTQQPSWVPWAFVGAGFLWLLGAKIVAVKNRHQERQEHFDMVYGPAVIRFLGAMRRQLNVDMAQMTETVPVPYPDPIKAWQGINKSEKFKRELIVYYKQAEPEEIFQARKTMKASYREWSRLVGRRLRSRRFDEWIAGVGEKHRRVFVLWLYAECALARHRGMPKPNFTDWEPLMDEWLGSE